jgi:hypothetical protein
LELVWKQNQEKEKQQKKIEEIRRKQEEKLIDKVKQSEEFLNLKEKELDERLSKQFKETSLKFKRIEANEEKIQRELRLLSSMKVQTRRRDLNQK